MTGASEKEHEARVQGELADMAIEGLLEKVAKQAATIKRLRGIIEGRMRDDSDRGARDEHVREAYELVSNAFGILRIASLATPTHEGDGGE